MIRSSSSHGMKVILGNRFVEFVLLLLVFYGNLLIVLVHVAIATNRVKVQA